MSRYPLSKRQYIVRQGDDIMYLDHYAITSLCTYVQFIELTLKTKFVHTFSHYYAPTSADVDLPIEWVHLEYVRLLFTSFTPAFPTDWLKFITVIFKYNNAYS